jgi:hypothetical protein
MLQVVAALVACPLAAGAQVYRCDGRDGPIFSQTPCAESAEAVSIDDSRMFSSPDSMQAAAANGAAHAGEEGTAIDLDDFLERLEEQRSTELAQFDSQIAQIRERMSRPLYPYIGEDAQQRVENDLKRLEAGRAAKVEEYADLEAEARRRAAENEKNRAGG